MNFALIWDWNVDFGWNEEDWAKYNVEYFNTKEELIEAYEQAKEWNNEYLENGSLVLTVGVCYNIDEIKTLF